MPSPSHVPSPPPPAHIGLRHSNATVPAKGTVAEAGRAVAPLLSWLPEDKASQLGLVILFFAVGITAIFIAYLVRKCCPGEPQIRQQERKPRGKARGERLPSVAPEEMEQQSPDEECPT